MKIKYTDSTHGITQEMLGGGFFAGWLRQVSPAEHLQLLAGSYKIWLAIDEDAGKVVGFITAISDGVLSAYIPLLEVLPTYQNQGIGGALVSKMLASLGNLYMIDLLCDPGLQPYYAKQGMHKATGMLARNYSRQNGEGGTNQ